MECKNGQLCFTKPDCNFHDLTESPTEEPSKKPVESATPTSRPTTGRPTGPSHSPTPRPTAAPTTRAPTTRDDVSFFLSGRSSLLFLVCTRGGVLTNQLADECVCWIIESQSTGDSAVDRGMLLRAPETNIAPPGPNARTVKFAFPSSTDA